MAELLRAPNLMKKVKEELGEVIGQCRDVEGADIDKLPYLQAVVKETLGARYVCQSRDNGHGGEDAYNFEEVSNPFKAIPKSTRFKDETIAEDGV
ncbi:hypothetical protein RJ639_024957, partial [Escallonia herrerae]